MSPSRTSPDQQIDANNDQDHRPPLREQGTQARYQSKIRQQEQHSENNQNQSANSGCVSHRASSVNVPLDYAHSSDNLCPLLRQELAQDRPMAELRALAVAADGKMRVARQLGQ